MRKWSLALLSLSMVVPTLCLPASAEESLAKKACMLPVKSIGCFTALAVGTPIAMARLSMKRYNEYVEDVGDMEGSVKKTGVVYALPMGIGEGVTHGLYYGPKNAISNFGKPFSKAAFSLEL